MFRFATGANGGPGCHRRITERAPGAPLATGHAHDDRTRVTDQPELTCDRSTIRSECELGVSQHRRTRDRCAPATMDLSACTGADLFLGILFARATGAWAV